MLHEGTESLVVGLHAVCSELEGAAVHGVSDSDLCMTGRAVSGSRGS